jgi:DNA-binding NarL/FixJ family response regulator
LLKDTPRANLVQAIEGTVAGQTFVDSKVAGKLFAQVVDHTFTYDRTLAETMSDRERDVLRLLAQGRSNAEIAVQLFLSEGTVRNYVSALFDKLGVSDRTQAAVIALRHGLAD